jgi:hypothetical protein
MADLTNFHRPTKLIVSISIFLAFSLLLSFTVGIPINAQAAGETGQTPTNKKVAVIYCNDAEGKTKEDKNSIPLLSFQ